MQLANGGWNLDQSNRVVLIRSKLLIKIINLASRFCAIWSNLSDSICHVWHEQGKTLSYMIMFHIWNMTSESLSKHDDRKMQLPASHVLISGTNQIFFHSLHHQTCDYFFHFLSNLEYEWPILGWISREIEIQLLDQPVFLWVKAGSPCFPPNKAAFSLPALFKNKGTEQWRLWFFIHYMIRVPKWKNANISEY